MSQSRIHLSSISCGKKAFYLCIFFRSLIGNSLTKEGPINDHKCASPGDPEMMAHDGPLWCQL